MRALRLLLLLITVVFVSAGLKAQVFEPGHPAPGRTTKEAKRPAGVNSTVPPLLAQAHTVFLSNGGADAGLFPHPFTGTQDRAYGYLYNALPASGHFRLVDSPADADIVIQIELSSPLGPLGNDKQKGTGDPLPTFKLTIFDRPTHYILWTLTQTVDPANLQKTHDKNFDDSLASLVTQLEALTK